jgi:hypothetical protein
MQRGATLKATWAWAASREGPIAHLSLGGILTVAALVLWHLTRGTLFTADDWLWITGRRAHSFSTLLDPYVGHLSLIPIASYQLMFHFFGLVHYWAYRVLIICGDLSCALLVYAYARPRVGELRALIPTALILFLGPGWTDILWSFQIAWLISIGAGIGALIALDRRDRVGDALACLLLCVALASQSVGIAFAVGTAVDVAVQRRRWADSWIVIVPLALYGIWTAAYQNQTFALAGLPHVVPFSAKAAAATLSSLVGLSGMSAANQTGTLLRFGYPLLGLSALTLIWLVTRRRYSSRAVSITVMLITFWVLTAVHRSDRSPLTSRYLYADCVLAVLLIADLVAAWSPSIPGTLVVGIIALAACISNFDVLRSTSAVLRQQGAENRAYLTAINLAHRLRGRQPLLAYPILGLSADQMLTAEAALGSPTETQVQLMTQPAPARAVVDSVLLAAGELRARPLRTAHAQRLGAQAALRPDLVTGGRALSRGACTLVVPRPDSPSPGSAQLEVTVPESGMTITGSPVTLAARRFGPEFASLHTVVSSRPVGVEVLRDADPAPWHLRVSATGRALVCPPSG